MVHIVNQYALEKITPDTSRLQPDLTADIALRGEEYAYQVVVFSDSDTPETWNYRFDTNIPINVMQVRQVPVPWPHYYHDGTGGYLTDDPCMLPDLLENVFIDGEITFSRVPIIFWVTLSGYFSGDFDVQLTLERENERLEHHFRMVISPQRGNVSDSRFSLCTFLYPSQMAYAHQIPVFSDQHWLLLQKYFEAAMNAGITRLGIPLFPMESDGFAPNDPTQLIIVKRKNRDFIFEYDRFDTWLYYAHRYTFYKFLVPPLFPSLKTGRPLPVRQMDLMFRETPLFDKSVTAEDDEYVKFVRSFLRSFKNHLKEIGCKDDFLYQRVMDPQLIYSSKYKEYCSNFEGIIPRNNLIDLFSDYGLSETALPARIAVPIANYAPFIERFNRVSGCYLDINHGRDVSNFLIAASGLKLRLLGIFCYRYGIDSLIFYGFCCYACSQKKGMDYPWIETDGNGLYPSGSLFLLYPGKEEPLPSIRLKQLQLAMQDYALLQHVDRYYGVDRLYKLIDKECPVSFTSAEEDPADYLNFRAHLIWLLRKYEPDAHQSYYQGEN